MSDDTTPDDTKRIKNILNQNMHMIIASADSQGLPWISPVTYSYDQECNLYWVSAEDSRHSINILERHTIAIVIYMFEPISDALYIDAHAKILQSHEKITAAIQILSTRSQLPKYSVQSPDDVSGTSPWRIYKAKPKNMYFRGEELVNGRSVTRRRTVVL